LKKRCIVEVTYWRNDVYKRDNYTCQICGLRGGKLNAHHLDGYHWCKERRFDIDNGVTLCKDCHDEFHQTYGRKNNTEEQFNKFVKSIQILQETS
jgi:5-methylcytosine-specific restriction endonuclease McrA